VYRNEVETGAFLYIDGGVSQFGTPWERMHCECTTAAVEVADPPAPGEPPAGDGLPSQAAASRARAAVVMGVAAARRAGRDWRMS
jgi:hypothetical protein